MDSFDELSLPTHPSVLNQAALWKARGQQAFSLLLATVPLAERMLLYNLATAALIWLPDQGILASFAHPRPDLCNGEDSGSESVCLMCGEAPSAVGSGCVVVSVSGSQPGGDRCVRHAMRPPSFNHVTVHCRPGNAPLSRNSLIDRLGFTGLHIYNWVVCDRPIVP